MTTHEKQLEYTSEDTLAYFQPRLAVKADGSHEKKAKGYLQINKEEKALEIGDVESMQYKLVRCLFSPRNFQSARYNSVFQTIDRVFFTLHADTPQAVSRDDSDSVEKITRMKLAIANVVKKLKQTEAGKHLKFHWYGEQIQMEVVAMA